MLLIAHTCTARKRVGPCSVIAAGGPRDKEALLPMRTLSKAHMPNIADSALVNTLVHVNMLVMHELLFFVLK